MLPAVILSCRRDFRAVLIVVDRHHKSFSERPRVSGLFCRLRKTLGINFSGSEEQSGTGLQFVW